jgi:outer membrane protein assembly factor BamE (lipoprotein component of BamABCDE complex)
MNRFSRLFPVLVVLLALAGCATDPGVRSFWTLSEADFGLLKPGMTQTEVEKIVGKPVLKMTFDRLDEEVWDYKFMGTQLRMLASVHFDIRGAMKYHTQELDQSYYGCGC